MSGKHVISEYEKKMGNNWIRVGSKSRILHRSFGDNPFAANGSRYGFGVIDEIGNMRVIVSQNVVSGSACIWIPNTSATYYSFFDLDTAIIEEPLIGKKIRVKRKKEINSKLLQKANGIERGNPLFVTFEGARRSIDFKTLIN